jgi:type IV secretory pathway VirB2 component (pilin)
MHGALPETVGWLAAVATGPLATGLAMLSVMGVGLTALTGTVPKAYVLRVLLGLALLFAAPLITRQLVDGSGDRNARSGQPAVQAETNDRLAAPQPICWTCR